jgi:hypothetical protein
VQALLHMSTLNSGNSFTTHANATRIPQNADLWDMLLVPSANDNYRTVAVPELKAHAQALPHLAYLLAVSQEVPVLSSHGSVMVRVPVPERYAIHKLIVSQLRNKSSSKPEKDLHQAAALIEALVDRYPGAIEDAASAVPGCAARYLARAVKALKQHLPKSAASAWDSVQAISQHT